MSNSNNGSYCGTNGGNASFGTGNTTGTTGSTGCGTGSSTCTNIKPGTTFNVNEVTSPGCYVCNWNGSLLRIGSNGFNGNGNMTFSFQCSDPLSVTYLTDEPTTSIEECRAIANAAYTYFNF